MYICAGVALFASERHTLRSIHLPYTKYATAYNKTVPTTHRNGVFRKSATQPPPVHTHPHAGAAVGKRVRALKRHVPPNIGRRRVRSETDLGRNVHGETVRTEPLRIQLLVLLPAILKPFGPSCAQPFLNNTVTALASEKLFKIPPVLFTNASRP